MHDVQEAQELIRSIRQEKLAERRALHDDTEALLDLVSDGLNTEQVHLLLPTSSTSRPARYNFNSTNQDREAK